MTHSTEAILTEIYDAWRAQNLELLATYLPGDFFHSINIPTEMHPLGGLRRGKAVALERLASIFEQFDIRHLDISHIATNTSGATVEVLTRCQHRESGAWLETTKSNLWTLEDGGPVELFEHYNLDRVQAFMQSAQNRFAPGSQGRAGFRKRCN